jgi:hypothetical protein
MERPGYTTYYSIHLEESRVSLRESAVQVQGVHGLPRRTDTAPGYTLFGYIRVCSCWIYTISQANSITKCLGDLVSLGCSGASGLSESCY